MKKFTATIWFICFCILLCACGKKEPVPFSGSLSTGESVYVDVLSIVPKHTLSSGTSVSEVVCECTTLSGADVWVCMSDYQYRNLDPTASFSSISGNFYSGAFYPDGIRIQGRTMSADKHANGLAAVTAPIIINCNGFAESTVEPESKIQPVLYADGLPAATPVYADILTVTPFELVSDNSYHVQFVICDCTTANGDMVPLYVSVRDYRACFDAEADFSIFDVVAETVELTDSVRVYGLLVEPSDLAGDLSDKIPFNLFVFASYEMLNAQ